MKKDTVKKAIPKKESNKDKRDVFCEALKSFIKKTTKKLGFKNPVFGYALLNSDYNGVSGKFGQVVDRAQGVVIAYDLKRLASQIEGKVECASSPFPDFLSSIL